MLNKLKELYSKSPSILRNFYGYIPNRIKYGKTYRYWENIINKKHKLERSPKSIVEYAIQNFSFYKNLYEKINIDNWDSIPLLDKKTVQSHLHEFENSKLRKFYVTTGGVTGKPAKFFQSNNVWYKEMAFLYSFFNVHGYKPPSLKVSFRGADFSKLNKNEFWIYNPSHYEINFSPFHINHSTINIYVDKLNELKSDFFHGYPSAFITLADNMKKHNLKLNYKPKCFFLISEGYDDKLIEYLESFFKCKITSFYGVSERVVFATPVNGIQSYKPDENYGYFELVDAEGNIISDNNIEGEIVGTSYDNLAMPLIRYKTGDFTHYIDYKNKIFNKITGKWGQNYLYGFGGEKISLTALNIHSEELNFIKKIQYIQTEYGKVNVSILTDIDNLNILKIESFLSKRVDKKIMFSIQVKDSLLLNKRGKAPLIISKIKSNFNQNF